MLQIIWLFPLLGELLRCNTLSHQISYFKVLVSHKSAAKWSWRGEDTSFKDTRQKKIHLGYILILLANESPKKKICKIKVMEAGSQKKKRDEEESSFLGWHEHWIDSPKAFFAEKVGIMDNFYQTSTVLQCIIDSTKQKTSWYPVWYPLWLKNFFNVGSSHKKCSTKNITK